MTALGDIAQAEAVATYSQAERRLERRAIVEHRSGHPIRARIAARMAHHVGVERIRNKRGDQPDEWERPA